MAQSCELRSGLRGHVLAAVFLTSWITSICTGCLAFLTWEFTLLLPGSGGRQPSRPIVVHEGENVRLRCAATGNPPPAVEWRRMDASVIPVGAWQGRYNSILWHTNSSACHSNTRRISTNSPIITPKASTHVALIYTLLSRLRMWTGWHLVRISVGDGYEHLTESVVYILRWGGKRNSIRLLWKAGNHQQNHLEQ